MEPQNSGLKTEKVNDMVKTPEDSHTEGLANNNTNPPTSNKSKPGSNAVTLNPPEETLHAKHPSWHRATAQTTDPHALFKSPNIDRKSQGKN